MLALQGDFAAHADALMEAGAVPVLVRTPAELADLDGLILPGGESTTFAGRSIFSRHDFPLFMCFHLGRDSSGLPQD